MMEEEIEINGEIYVKKSAVHERKSIAEERLISDVKAFVAGKDRDDLPPMSQILNEQFGFTWRGSDEGAWNAFVRRIAKAVWED